MRFWWEIAPMQQIKAYQGWSAQLFSPSNPND
jgi:hypothetical protein